jgi:hypothetical protein
MQASKVCHIRTQEATSISQALCAGLPRKLTEHLVAQIDPENAKATLGKREKISPGTTTHIDNQPCRTIGSRRRLRQGFVDDPTIKLQKWMARMELIVIGRDRRFVDIVPSPSRDANGKLPCGSFRYRHP